MTAPIPPAGPPVRDRKYWTAVLHNAAQVGPDDPRYGQARAVIQMAKDNLTQQADSANAKDVAEAQPPMPGKVAGTLMNAFQTLTSGFGDEALGGLAGMAKAATFGGFDPNMVSNTQQGFNEQLQRFRGAQKGLSLVGSGVGVAMNPLNRLLAPATAGLGPIATGAAYGATLGGAQGMGEATGNFTQRLPSGAAGAAIGGLTGAVLGKLVKPTRTLTANARGMVRQLLGAKAAPSAVKAATDNVVEATIRRDLVERLNVHPEDVESIVANWRETGNLDLRAARTNPGPPPEPIATRPGETVTPKSSPASLLQPGNTVTQVAPQGLEVTGVDTRPIPPEPPAISLEQAQERAARTGRRPGHPIFRGEGSPTSSKAVRGGEPLTPSAAGVQGTTSPKNPFGRFSNDDLLAMLSSAGKTKATPHDVLGAVRAELIRRLGLR